MPCSLMSRHHAKQRRMVCPQLQRTHTDTYIQLMHELGHAQLVILAQVVQAVHTLTRRRVRCSAGAKVRSSGSWVCGNRPRTIRCGVTALAGLRFEAAAGREKA